ncbi:MAG: DNA-processing protein DprA [Planctomycetota bacterium]
MRTSSIPIGPPPAAPAPRSEEDEFALTCMSMAETLSANRIRRLIEAAGSPAAVLTQDVESLTHRSGLMATDVERLRTQVQAEPLRLAATRDHKARQAHGVRLLTVQDPDYPPLLKAAPDPPLALWVWGVLQPQDVYAVAILGSSRCSEYGAGQTKRFARRLAEYGLTVVNGGEVGIDAVALEAALETGGRAVACLGAGLHNHGRPHHGLYERLVESGQGAVISCAALQTPANPANQVMGDYAVAGMSIAMLITEAALHSGALIAARIAHEQLGRDLFSLCDQIDSSHARGTLRLIAERRARLTLDPDTLFQYLIESTDKLAHQVSRQARPLPLLNHNFGRSRDPFQVPLTEIQRRCVESLRTSMTPDQLAEATGLPVSQTRSSLHQLALAGILAKSLNRFDWPTTYL